VGRFEGRRLVGRTRRIWKNNIKTNLQEVRWDMGFFDLAENWDTWRALDSAVMNISGSIKCGEFLD
jgi:hypothetical protein